MITSYDLYKKPLGQEVQERNKNYYESVKYLEKQDKKKNQIDQPNDSDLEENAELYKWIIDDIERLLEVIPLKIKLQQLYDKEKKKRENLEEKLKMLEKLHEQDEKERVSMIKALNTYAEQASNAEQEKITKFFSLQDQLKETQEQLDKVNKELFLYQSIKQIKEIGVQTVVDSTEEQILLQEEFNRQLVKYRKVNCDPDYKQLVKPEVIEMISQPNNQYLLCLQIQQAIKKIKDGTSRYISETKGIKSVLKMFGNFIQAKINALQNAKNDKHAYDSIDSYFYYYMLQTYGLDQLAQKYTEIFINSINLHKKADARLLIFSQFIGLEPNVILSFQTFEKFIIMIRATGQGIFNLFNLPLNIMFVDYQRVRHTFKQLLGENADFQIYKFAFFKIKKTVIINTSNKVLQKSLKLEEYEVWKDMNEQIISSKYCRVVNFLNEMFKSFGIYEDNLDESAGENLLEEHFVVYNHKKIQKVQFLEYLISNLDLTDFSRCPSTRDGKKTFERVEAMVDKIFFQAQENKETTLNMRQINAGFMEKIEVKVPVQAFFEVGIDVCSQWEQQENRIYEHIYQFYCQCIPVYENPNDLVWIGIKQEASSRSQILEKQILTAKNVHQKINYEGMEFDQFLLYAQDTGHPLASDIQNTSELQEIFNRDIKDKGRTKMFCCDFIETIRKYKLACPLPILQEMMKERELIIAKCIRKNLIYQNQVVPDDIEAVCFGKEIDKPKESFFNETSIKSQMFMKTKKASQMGAEFFQQQPIKEQLSALDFLRKFQLNINEQKSDTKILTKSLPISTPESKIEPKDLLLKQSFVEKTDKFDKISQKSKKIKQISSNKTSLEGVRKSLNKIKTKSDDLSRWENEVDFEDEIF